ncbi:MAG: lysophospholipid acyltransferase family protein [Planctomycetota bacterium]
MKVQHPFLTAAIGLFGAGLMRLWIGSLRVQVDLPRPTIDFLKPDCDGNYIYILWHDTLLLPTYYYRKANQHTLISQSQDGEYITRIVQKLGWNVIRGSSSRGAASAVRQLLGVTENKRRVHLAITADGPRGPRHVLKDGPVYLASRSGLAIVPIGVAYDRPWRARSWDRFILPKPFSKAHIVCGEDIHVPANADRDEIESYRRKVQAEMERLEQRAEARLAERTGRPQSPLPAPVANPSSRAA